MPSRSQDPSISASKAEIKRRDKRRLLNLSVSSGTTNYTGELGAGKFRFVVKPEFTAPLADHITDFNGTQADKIEISRAAFGIATTAKVTVTTVSVPTALDIGLKTTAMFVYDSSTGNL